MKLRRLSPPVIACALTALVLAAGALGPFMRETDQAWLLDGGMGIANGHPEIAQAEFNFDKQFVSYLLPGILFKFLPRPFTGDELVLAGNIFGMFFFWGALGWLLARSAKKLPLALVLPVILTPTFLVYSPFYASAFTSAAFVILLATFLARKNWSWPLHLVSFALAFCAVGARADAIFLLPLLAMLHSPQRTFVSVLKSPNTWLMAAGGLAAFFLGRALYRTNAVDFAPLAFNPKQFLGFAAFGLGGAALLLLAGLVAVAAAWRANRCRLWLAFLWLALFLPMGYYSLQLLSPRHCTVGAVSILIFVCAARGRILFQNFFHANRFGALLKFNLIALAVVPVFVGVNLNDLHRPKLTLTHPTWLPSGAGVAPTGAYLAFALDVRRQGGFLDHNHALWAAAQTARYETNAAGRVPYLSTPVASYTVFTIRLQGKIPELHSLGENPPPPWFYTDNRSFLRFQFAFPLMKPQMDEFFAATKFEPVAEPRWQGLTIYRASLNPTGSVDSLSAGLWALNRAFGLDEFRPGKIESLQKIPDAWTGKRIFIASRSALDFPLAIIPRTLTNPTLGSWWIYEISPLRAGENLGLQLVEPEKVFIGVSALPAWMSLQKL